MKHVRKEITEAYDRIKKGDVYDGQDFEPFGFDDFESQFGNLFNFKFGGEDPRQTFSTGPCKLSQYRSKMPWLEKKQL